MARPSANSVVAEILQESSCRPCQRANRATLKKRPMSVSAIAAQSQVLSTDSFFERTERSNASNDPND
jgi:hypothetical protein